MAIDKVTKNHYNKSRVVKSYSKWKSLFPPEVVIFDRYKRNIEGKSILDIGCGGGRTTEFLTKMTKNYIGVDYSAKMIDVCRKQYNDAQFIQCDSSNMSIFSDESFDFAIFSFNGIDCMSHEKRIRTLSEVYRVLKYEGVFAFSSHNRNDRQIVVGFNKYEKIGIEFFFKNIVNIISYLKTKNAQVFADTYDILSDPLAGFGQLTYYITKRDQVRQLKGIGFSDIEIMDWDGVQVDPDTLDQTSNFFYYTCRKVK